MFHKATKWILFAFAIIIIDLAIKYWINENYEAGQWSGILNNFLIIGNIKTLKLSYGWGNSININYIVSKIFEGLMFLFFIRAWLIKSINQLYKVSALFIILGLLGNYIDMFLFSGSNKQYIQMDYLNIRALSSSFFNLSSLLTYAGFVLLIIALIKKPGDLKLVFSGKKYS